MIHILSSIMVIYASRAQYISAKSAYSHSPFGNTTMRVTIFSVLLIGTLCVGHCQNEKQADSNNFPADTSDNVQNTRKYHLIKDVQNNNDVVDPNPSKIPSLADPSITIGFLQPIDIDLADKCFPRPQCDPNAKYRTMDGVCNNLLFPVWGKSNIANTRIIDANYTDGINQPRKAVSGSELPNVRHIRKTIFKDLDRPAPGHNLLIMQYGQTIAHDTELLIDKTLSDGSTLNCCNPDGSTPDILPDGCVSITIPPEESEISKNRCFSIPRAADTIDLGCQITPARQQIGVTSFIDASLVYGSDVTTANSLRSFSNGKLRRQIGPNGRSYLPNAQHPSQSCNVPNDNTVCYVSGDPRVNQHPDIAVQTISLLRLHNFLCDELKRINPLWVDEKLYQEARRILIGMYQHVTYNEFVPGLIGKDFAAANSLLPLKNGFDNNYDQFLNPTTFTSFTAVAFRSFHSYIQGFVDLFNEGRSVTSEFRLSDFFLRTDIVQKPNNYDSLTRGLLTQHAQEQDEFFTEEVSEFLFRVPNKTMGLDLISLDLVRGRDYGEPSYNSFRQLCGLNAAQSFDDLSDQISKKNIDALASLYEDVNDIDFFAAGILEKPKPGAVAGHTFQCIIGEMFFRWKFGDRFFYEFGDQPGSFSLDQLTEIRKATLPLIVCMTTDIKFVQQDAFNVPDLNTNPLIPCKLIPKLNFAPWKNV